jgi:tRNA(Arg) A34 adenosine deaminase TadA
MIIQKEMMPSIYQEAAQRALRNNQVYHLAAILRRKGKVVKIGENTDKTHPKFLRHYPDGGWSAYMHAEMNVLRFARPGDEIEVFRVKKECQHFTMAKPCELCQKAMQKAGIKKVHYTNWDGIWETIKF